jgi:3',5'-cyclic AMP phosphodiesterase CpdA
MTLVRILHASDLHIAKDGNLTSPFDHFTPGNTYNSAVNRMLASTYDPSVLQRFADFVHDRAARGTLDAVIMTGDIATTGATEDLHKARDFIQAAADPRLRSQSALKDPTLNGAQCHVWLLPGNHDRYHTKLYLPGGKDFDSIFTAEWKGPVQAYQPIMKTGLSVVVIAADFNLNSVGDADRLLGWLGQGKVYTDVLDQLEVETRRCAGWCRLQNKFPICIIWAVHFPPDYPQISSNLKLLDGDSLIQRANYCQVNAIIAGHTHDPVRYRRPGMKFDVFCAGTTSQAFVPEGNHFRIIEIDVDAAGGIILSSEEYRYRNIRGGVITNGSGFYRA